MKRKCFIIGMVALLLAMLIGCQTKPAPNAPQESAIEVEQSGFSPNGGAGQNTINIAMLYGNGQSIVAWKVEVANAESTVRTWTGDAAYLPASLAWNGKDDAGTLAPEGTYVARLSIEYGKTYQPVSAESGKFVLDITPPTGSITLSPPQFTPSERGVTEPMTLSIDVHSSTAKMDSWTLDIYDVAGGLVRSFSGQWPTIEAVWDGSTLSGGYVFPAMSYRVVAIVRDEYGNSASLKAAAPVSDIPMSTQPDKVQPLAKGFSPTSETLPRSIDLALTFGNEKAIIAWKLSLVHAEKGVQRSWNGDPKNLPGTVTWDGTTAAGTIAPEGAYTATLSIDYGNNYKPVLVRSAAFVLDVTPPAANVAADPVKLAPDGKGGIQPVTFTLYGSSPTAALKNWTLEVRDANGKTMASFKDAWPSVTTVWDGALAGGGRADPTKVFSYVAHVQDEYGNASTVRGSLTTGELPAAQGRVSVTANGEGFSPNGDGFSDTMSFLLSYGQPQAVSAWRVDITYSGLGVQKSFSGDGRNLPLSIVWDGATDTGTAAIDGVYTAKLTVTYGTIFSEASVSSTPFALANTPPLATVSLSSPLFSPIESSDTITLSLSARSTIAKIDSWAMDIYDPGGNVFKSFSGKWPANQVVWDGRGSNGELVQSAEDYPVVARVRDQFGNTGITRITVPVDILVEKRGDGYRILASRIFFKAFTADYTDVEPDLAAQNMARLDALATKLEKFPGYKIHIVGHAVMIHWDDPALGRAEQEAILVPLSKARAEAVVKALVERGLDAARFTTEGVGASDQLVPDSDYKDRWQNRRVALFLEKE